MIYPIFYAMACLGATACLFAINAARAANRERRIRRKVEAAYFDLRNRHSRKPSILRATQTGKRV